jgi:Uma2 family endonuclease
MNSAAMLEAEANAAPPQDDRDTLYEIVHGQRVEKPAMSAYASLIGFQLAHHVQSFLEQCKRGRAVTEIIFGLGKDLQRRPDAAYISFERWPEDRLPPHTDPWPVIPNLAIEVVSKSNPAEDLLDKLEEYFRAGVELVWIVYPRQRHVYVYESPTQVHIVNVTEELDGGKVLPGFRLPLATLFGAVPKSA